MVPTGRRFAPPGGTRPGISRFRVRVFDAPRNNDTADDTVALLTPSFTPSFRDGPNGGRFAPPGGSRPGISRFRVRVFDAPRNDGGASRRRRAQQPFGGRPRLGGDLRTREHPCDFLAAVIGGERVDAGGDALALVERVF